ncbi:MAG: SAM-dependent methyltransferase, partial [Firmicutes bacterium]|nr:SAM-dependent methyltransferase [Bacillota bacterium]
MAELDLTLNEKADSYSDGDIENTLLELAQNGFDITTDKNIYPFAAVYHFSPQRENILNWYPFDQNGSCLEIGAGCGAITGMLCQKHKKVVSVDISERRCKI